jgi:heptosyltransferase-2
MERILIINPFGIGDVLFSTPLVRAVKKKYPDSFIGYLCNEQAAPLLRNNPAIDRLFFYSRGDFKKIKQHSRWQYIKAFAQALADIRAQCFTLAIDLSMVNQYSFILWCLGVPRRWGFDYRRRGCFLTHKLLVRGFERKHVVEYYQELLALFGINDFEPRLDCYVDARDHAWAAAFLEQRGIHSRALLAGIAPFGGGSWGQDAKNKQWPLERFAGVARALMHRFSGEVIVFGTHNDEHDAVLLRELIGTERNIIDATGKTSLGQLAALLQRCALLVSNDSGPLHIACALGVKTVSVFGPVDEQVYGPVGDNASHRVIVGKTACRPCYRNFVKPYCVTMRCLQDVDEPCVVSAAAELLNNG